MTVERNLMGIIVQKFNHNGVYKYKENFVNWLNTLRIGEKCIPLDMMYHNSAENKKNTNVPCHQYIHCHALCSCRSYSKFSLYPSPNGMVYSRL